MMKFIASLFCLSMLTPAMAETTYPLLDEIIQNYQVERLRQVSAEILARASGADIIGNGTGVVEQNFHYAYRNLDRTFSQCLSTPLCVRDQRERHLLGKMRDLILKFRWEKNRIIFLKSDDFEHFFAGDLDPTERVAKTGPSSEFPIFINLTMVQELNIASDLSLIIGILAHEVGHQVGMASHSYLDDLSSRLRLIHFENTQSIALKERSTSFRFDILKARQTFKYDETILFMGNQLIKVPHLGGQFICPNKMRPNAATLTNPHWGRPYERGGLLVMSVRAWAEFTCGDKILDKNIVFLLNFKQTEAELQWVKSELLVK